MTINGDFTPEQKRYLEGFTSGVQTARAGRGMKPLGGHGGNGNAVPIPAAPLAPGRPDPTPRITAPGTASLPRAGNSSPRKRRSVMSIRSTCTRG